MPYVWDGRSGLSVDMSSDTKFDPFTTLKTDPLVA